MSSTSENHEELNVMDFMGGILLKTLRGISVQDKAFSWWFVDNEVSCEVTLKIPGNEVPRKVEATFHQYLDINFRKFLLHMRELELPISRYSVACYGKLQNTFFYPFKPKNEPHEEIPLNDYNLTATFAGNLRDTIRNVYPGENFMISVEKSPAWKYYADKDSSRIWYSRFIVLLPDVIYSMKFSVNWKEMMTYSNIEAEQSLADKINIHISKMQHDFFREEINEINQGQRNYYGFLLRNNRIKDASRKDTDCNVVMYSNTANCQIGPLVDSLRNEICKSTLFPENFSFEFEKLEKLKLK